MLKPPSTSATGVGTYWGTTGTIPLAVAVPILHPQNQTAIPALVATVAPVATQSQSIIFQAASDPGVDPVDYSDYSAWLCEGQWVYFSTVNKVYRMSNYRALSSHTFIADIIEGNVPSVADVAYAGLTPQYVFAAQSYSYVVTAGVVEINDTVIAPGISATEPVFPNMMPKVVAFDATAGTLLISFNTY